MRGIDDTWQADLVSMIPYKKQNKGYRYLLTVIDTFSKYAWALPVRRKSGEDLAIALKELFKQGRVPKNLHVDKGTEFYNKVCKDLLRKKRVHLYSTESHLKASIVERFNRTIKNWMWKEFSLRGKYVWIDIIEKLIKRYNNSKHRTIKMKPKDVNSKNAKKLEKIYKKLTFVNTKPPKFKVADQVRINKHKHLFEKGYTPNWTTEIFTIEKVCPTAPYTYKLKDYRGQSIVGGFYEGELIKAVHPDVFLVEKVIRKRGNQVYVKWLGFDNTHNSWIDKNQI